MWWSSQVASAPCKLWSSHVKVRRAGGNIQTATHAYGVQRTSDVKNRDRANPQVTPELDLPGHYLKMVWAIYALAPAPSDIINLLTRKEKEDSLKRNMKLTSLKLKSLKKYVRQIVRVANK